MRAVIVDAGNTRVAFAAWAADDGWPACVEGTWRPAPALRRLGSLPTPRGEADDAAFVSAVRALLAGSPAVPLVLVSVVPRVEPLLASLAGDLRRVDHRSPLPFRHRLREPAATGADRLCNVAAAVAAGLDAALVVDVGTATTCDVLREGVFEGGVIAPGMAFGLEQIGRGTARLQPVPFARTTLVAGRETTTALAAGAYHAAVGGVEALIAGLLAAHGPLPVIVTGGLAGHLAGPGRFLDADWTLRGAAALAGPL